MVDRGMETVREEAGIVVELCAVNAEAEWNAFSSDKDDACIYRRFGWKEIFEKVYGNTCFYLKAEEKGVVVGILPLVLKKSRLFGRYLVSLPYFDHVGICCEREDVREKLLVRAQQLAEEHQAKYMELRHDREHELGLLTKRSKVTMVLELPSDPDRLFSLFQPRVRNKVRNALKDGFTLSEGGRELIEGFFRVYSTNMRDLGSPSHRQSFFAHICDKFSEEVRIFSVVSGGNTLASGFTMASGDTLTIPWVSSLRKYSDTRANIYLYWSILKYACESGFSYFSFGRSTPDEGTYQFKKRWGAEPKPLYWQYWLPNGGEMPELNMGNSKYSLPIRVWKRMPVAITRILGPRLIRNLS